MKQFNLTYLLNILDNNKLQPTARLIDSIESIQELNALFLYVLELAETYYPFIKQNIITNLLIQECIHSSFLSTLIDDSIIQLITVLLESYFQSLTSQTEKYQIFYNILNFTNTLENPTIKTTISYHIICYLRDNGLIVEWLPLTEQALQNLNTDFIDKDSLFFYAIQKILYT